MHGGRWTRHTSERLLRRDSWCYQCGPLNSRRRSSGQPRWLRRIVQSGGPLGTGRSSATVSKPNRR